MALKIYITLAIISFLLIVLSLIVIPDRCEQKDTIIKGFFASMIIFVGFALMFMIWS
jgi:hypothetical protein